MSTFYMETHGDAFYKTHGYFAIHRPRPVRAACKSYVLQRMTFSLFF